MELGPHAAFIVAAYASTAAVVIALALWVLLDYRAQRRTLAALEERGVTRRSATAVRRPGEPVRSEAT
jgi:heme exporter protein D